MARLRHEEEARSYDRMLNPPRYETFRDRFPNSTASFASVNAPTSKADMGDDQVTLDEVHRQVTLIINFLVSIAGVAGTLWVTARWWPLPARLFLTLGGSIIVAIAEVAVYSGYVWRMEEGKRKNLQKEEVREVMKTWVLGDQIEDQTVLLQEDSKEEQGVRKRVVTSKDNI